MLLYVWENNIANASYANVMSVYSGDSPILTHKGTRWTKYIIFTQQPAETKLMLAPLTVLEV